MMRQKLAWVAVLVLLTGLGAGAWWVGFAPSAARHNITRQSLGEIMPGLTEPAVEQLLGGPAGDYSGGKVTVGALDLVMPVGATTKEWIGDDVAIIVCFDAGGRVLFAQPLEMFPVPRESFLERLRHWLGL
jgi:hypothetical protein